MKIRIGLLAIAAALLTAAPARAADFNGTVSATSPAFEWSGGPGSGIAIGTPLGGLSSRFLTSDCLDGFAECEEALIKVETAGTLTVSVNADDDSTDAIDVYLYPSNEAGEYDVAEDDLGAAEGATEASDEKVDAAVTPGYYMARVEFYDASEDTYKGAAVLSGFEAPAAAPPPSDPAPTPPPPPSQPSQPAPSEPAPAQSESGDSAKKKRAAKKCRKKAKKIKNAKKRKRALKRCARKAR